MYVHRFLGVHARICPPCESESSPYQHSTDSVTLQSEWTLTSYGKTSFAMGPVNSLAFLADDRAAVLMVAGSS
jgi:hypothetical protein